ncbi:hypothetical protein Goshw_022579 [Gossypium schwendimanii]|uniref:Ribosomal protein S11 n=1 Tax=Gossypium schwendimanii TaxID=34291 RepID=A0A7J9NBW3_GOSSC|nr:hypothetical protein [Gossypium schwendimanii]
MAKPIPKVGSRRNGRSSARKSARRILKGVIHVQASFNNTIVTVTNVRGRVISWSSVGTCGFKGTRKSAPFAAQTATGNVIQAIVEQGMQQAEVMIKGPSLERDAALRPIVEVGPGYVTTQDIILPPSTKIVDNTQHVASLTEPIDLCIGLQIKRNRGYSIKMPKNFYDGSYPIDVVFMPVRNANHSIHCYGNDNEKHEMLFSRNMDKWNFNSKRSIS